MNTRSANSISEMIHPRQARIYRAAMALFSDQADPQINVSELAAAAGISRSTVYNHIGRIDTLFAEVSAHVIGEMDKRLQLAMPAQAGAQERLALAIRFYVRRSHEEPHWGRFMMRHALSTRSFEALLLGLPLQDVQQVMHAAANGLRPEQLPAVMALIGGTVLTSMRMVQEGYRTWREAGSDAAELVLRTLGLPAERAHSISTAELPPLPEACEA